MKDSNIKPGQAGSIHQKGAWCLTRSQTDSITPYIELLTVSALDTKSEHLKLALTVLLVDSAGSLRVQAPALEPYREHLPALLTGSAQCSHHRHGCALRTVSEADANPTMQLNSDCSWHPQFRLLTERFFSKAVLLK